MIDYRFSDQLTKFPFARRNQYNYSSPQPSALLFTAASQEVALIYKEPSGYHKEGFLMFTEATQFRERTLNKDKVMEIINTAHILMKLNYGGEVYLMGKGFIGLFDDQTKGISPLFIITIPNNDDWTDIDVKFYISKIIRTKPFRPIQVIVETLIEDHKGDIIFSDDISKLVGDRIKLPSFKTLTERRQYVDNLIDFCLTVEKQKFVVL